MRAHSMALTAVLACTTALADTAPAQTPPQSPLATDGTWMSAPPSWLAAVGSPEVSIVRGVLEVEDATHDNARFRYTAEVGLDAQRRVVRFVLDGLQSEPAAQAANAPYTSVNCRFSKVRNIFDCLSRTPAETYALQSTLSLDTATQAAVLIQTEERRRQRDAHVEHRNDARTVFMYRWRDGQLGEPLFSTREQSRVGRDLDQGLDVLRTEATTRTEYHNLMKASVTGTEKTTSLNVQDGTTQTLKNERINDQFALKSMHPSGWTTAAQWQITHQIATGNPPLDIQAKAHLDYRSRFDANRMQEGRMNLLMLDGKPGKRPPTPQLTAQTRYAHWSPAPAQAPWRFMTEASGSFMDNLQRKFTGEVGQRNGQWVESMTANVGEQTTYRSTLTLATDQPVTIAGGFIQNSFCARIDHSCPGYDAPGLLNRLQELSEWVYTPSPIDLPSIPPGP